MKFKELKQLDNNALSEKLKELKLELIKENSQIAIGTVPKSPGKIRLAKKTIAKINSLLSNKNSLTKATEARK